MRSFLYIGRLNRSQLTPLNQALFGKFIYRLGLMQSSKIRGAHESLPQFGIYTIKKYKIINQLLYVEEADLIDDFESS